MTGLPNDELIKLNLSINTNFQELSIKFTAICSEDFCEVVMDWFSLCLQNRILWEVQFFKS